MEFSIFNKQNLAVILIGLGVAALVIFSVNCGGTTEESKEEKELESLCSFKELSKARNVYLAVSRKQIQVKMGVVPSRLRSIDIHRVQRVLIEYSPEISSDGKLSFPKATTCLALLPEIEKVTITIMDKDFVALNKDRWEEIEKEQKYLEEKDIYCRDMPISICSNFSSEEDLYEFCGEAPGRGDLFGGETPEPIGQCVEDLYEVLIKCSSNLGFDYEECLKDENWSEWDDLIFSENWNINGFVTFMMIEPQEAYMYEAYESWHSFGENNNPILWGNVTHNFQ